MEEDIKILEQSLLELYGHDTVIVNKKSLENLLTKYKNLVEIEAEHQRINGELGAELEKKDKIIDLMAGYLSIIRDCPNEDKGANIDCENRCSNDDDIYEKCWKIYFENKVKESKQYGRKKQ